MYTILNSRADVQVALQAERDEAIMEFRDTEVYYSMQAHLLRRQTKDYMAKVMPQLHIDHIQETKLDVL